MKRFKVLVLSLGLIVFGTGAALVPTTVGAVNAIQDACNSSNSGDNPVCNGSAEDAPSLVKTLVNVLLFIIGALAVVMIIWGGIMYSTSAGDSGRVKKAKDTLMYAIIGLVVAFLAFAIVNWVLNIF